MRALGFRAFPPGFSTWAVGGDQESMFAVKIRRLASAYTHKSYGEVF